MFSDDEMRRRLEGFADVWQRVAQSNKTQLPVQLMPRRQRNNPAEDHLPGVGTNHREYNK